MAASMPGGLRRCLLAKRIICPVKNGTNHCPDAKVSSLAGLEMLDILAFSNSRKAWAYNARICDMGCI